MFPPQLYLLRPGEQVPYEWLDPFTESRINSASQNLLATAFDVPAEKVLFLFSANTESDPGGNIASNIFIALVNPNITGTVRLKFFPVGGTAQHIILDWQGFVVVPPNWKVQAQSNFSGSLGNSIRLDICGLLIPLGNFLRRG